MTGVEFAGFLLVVTAPWILTGLVWALAIRFVLGFVSALVK